MNPAKKAYCSAFAFEELAHDDRPKGSAVMNDIAAHLGENIGVVIGYIGVGLTAWLGTRVQSWAEYRKGRKNIERSVRSNVVLQGYLAEIRGRHDCSRITLSQFHNGEYFASGASVQKTTLTHFVTKPGIDHPVNPESGQDVRATPSSYFPHLLDILFRDGVSVCTDFNAPDAWAAKYQAANGLRTCVMCLIPGGRVGEAYGVLTFSWIEIVPVSSELLSNLKDYARRASLYL